MESMNRETDVLTRMQIARDRLARRQEARRRRQLRWIRPVSGLWRRTAHLVLVAMLVCPPGVPVVMAAPQGGKVVAGDVTIHTDGSVTVINASDGAIINFSSFDIFAHEMVRFIQPSEMARVLNRVLSTDPSFIDGSLFANGNVYIVNPHGVFFGGNAVIDVGGLVAGAGTLSDENFLAGVDHFTELISSVKVTVYGLFIFLVGILVPIIIYPTN